MQPIITVSNIQKQNQTNTTFPPDAIQCDKAPINKVNNKESKRE